VTICPDRLAGVNALENLPVERGCGPAQPLLAHELEEFVFD
jgi:hypothetical protein